MGQFELAANECVRLCRLVVRKGSAFPKRFSNKTLAGKAQPCQQVWFGALAGKAEPFRTTERHSRTHKPNRPTTQVALSVAFLPCLVSNNSRSGLAEPEGGIMVFLVRRCRSHLLAAL